MLTYSKQINENIKEDLYLKGQTLLSSCRYDDAKIVFSELADYKDSEALVIQCDELKLEDLYKKANEAKEQKYYEQNIYLRPHNHPSCL